MTQARAVLLLTALQREAAALASMLRLTRQGDARIGTVADTLVKLHVTGPGCERAAEAVRGLAGSSDVVGIVFAGLAGGLDPSLQPGAVVESAWVRDEAGRVWQLSSHDGPGVGIVSVSHVCATVEAKAALAAASGAVAVDMESAGAAAAAERLGKPLRVLRAISDPADVSLPTSIGAWIDGAGRTRVGRVMRDLMRQPSLWPTVRKLARYSRVGLDALGHRLPGLIQELGDETHAG